MGLPFLLLTASAQLAAQGVRVRVTDEAGGEPVPGALVSLKRGGFTTREHLTDGQGTRLIAAAADSGYTIEVRRVGFAPYVSPAFALAASDTVSMDVRLPMRRVVLPPPITRRDAAVCRPGDAGRGRSGDLWEQVRTALASTEIVRVEGLEPLAIRRFERALSRNGDVRSESQMNASAFGTRLFRAVSPEELSRTGFIAQDSMGQPMFHAPDATVLLSDAFANDHCFTLVAGSGSTAGMLGLHFEPSTARRVADVEGVLWVDLESLHLRFAEFTYRFPTQIEARDAGGRILFEQLASSSWIAREWIVRTPVLTTRGQLLGYREEGGEAMTLSPRMRFIADSIANSKKVPGLITGLVFDSLGGVGFDGATVWLDSVGPRVKTDPKGVFFMRGVPPGLHTLHFSHPMLDSIGVAPRGAWVNVVSEQMVDAKLYGPALATLTGNACSDTMTVMTGLVRDVNTGLPLDSVDVTLTWIDIALDATNHPIRITPGETVARTDASGRYGACVAPSLEITAFAQRGHSRTGRIDVMPDARRLGILHFMVDTKADSLKGNATLRGYVRYQDGSPLVNAIITLTDPEFSTSTDSTGRFWVGSLPGGTRVIDSKAIGHAPVRTVAELKPGDTASVTIYMRKVTTLDAIIVRAAAEDRSAQTMAALAARRRRRQGYSVSQKTLDAMKDLQLDALVRSIPNLTLQTSPPSVTLKVPNAPACFPSVWLDGRRSDISVIQNIRTRDVLSVELMRGRNEIPVEYQGFSNCGALLIWLKGASAGN